MICPACGSNQVGCLETRNILNERCIRRRRKCFSCEYRWATIETCNKLKGMTKSSDVCVGCKFYGMNSYRQCVSCIRNPKHKDKYKLERNEASERKEGE